MAESNTPDPEKKRLLKLVSWAYDNWKIMSLIGGCVLTLTGTIATQIHIYNENVRQTSLVISAYRVERDEDMKFKEEFAKAYDSKIQKLEKDIDELRLRVK